MDFYGQSRRQAYDRHFDAYTAPARNCYVRVVAGVALHISRETYLSYLWQDVVAQDHAFK